jgi:hypothetical protein
MIKMDLAYKDNMVDHLGDHIANLHSNDKFFVPTTLELEDIVAKGERCLQWLVEFGVQAIKYIGRRLQCQDENVTTLTQDSFHEFK